MTPQNRGRTIIFIMATLIVDSGSTKTDWIIIAGDGSVKSFKTEGINPVVGDMDAINKTITEAFAPKVEGIEFNRVFFYGAGCTKQKKHLVEECLVKLFPKAEIEVASDVLAAARALCGHKEGIACILGTGSNSCLFNGRDIVKNVSPLGYILGDEGSGAVLGRTFISDVLKGDMPQDIRDDFFEETKLTEDDIIENVYRKPMPNRFLASFVPFLKRHHHDSQIGGLLVANFRRFLQRNVKKYNRPDLPVNFIGGVANSFPEEISVALKIEQLTLGRVEQSPQKGLVFYHSTPASEDII